MIETNEKKVNKEMCQEILGSSPRMTDKVRETGRSMVEMLGVLAVMGVLSIGGVAGYRYAIDKYIANEILNEVRKRAITASQQRILGHPINLAEYGASADTIRGYATAVTNDYNGNAGFFTIAVSGIEQRICDHVIHDKLALASEEKVGDVVVGDDTDCAEGQNNVLFAFANTLNGEMALPEPDWACEGVACPAGTGCSNGMCICQETGQEVCRTECCSAGTNCSNGVCVCPETGQEMCGTTCCGKKQLCSVYPRYECVNMRNDSYMNDSYMNDSDMSDGRCVSSTDCTGADEYCSITWSRSTEWSGTCKPLGSKSEAFIEGLGTVYKSDNNMNWWSAQNWCQALRKRLVSISSLNCFNGKSSGYCCGENQTDCNSDPETQSTIMQALRNKWSSLSLWTGTTNSSNVFGIELYNGAVVGVNPNSGYYAYSTSYYALCE